MSAGEGLIRQRRRVAALSARGFTLAELLLVVVILSVLAAMSVPRFRAIRSHWDLEETTRRLVADLRRAKTEAVRRGSAAKILFEAEGYRLVIEEPVDVIPTPDWEDAVSGSSVVRREITLVRREISPQAHWSPSAEVFRFESDGTSSGGTLRGTTVERDRGFEVTLDGFLGAATARELAPEELGEIRWRVLPES
jgi:prepilin-type N-terminal cleavage/methylation domain-containing protein